MALPCAQDRLVASDVIVSRAPPRGCDPPHIREHDRVSHQKQGMQCGLSDVRGEAPARGVQDAWCGLLTDRLGFRLPLRGALRNRQLARKMVGWAAGGVNLARRRGENVRLYEPSDVKAV